MDKKKTIMIICLITGLLLLTLGVTFSIYNLNEIGEKNSKLIAGDIYMHYTESSNLINLENQMPSSTYDESSYFEFTIDGKNTTKDKDIWYEIILNHGSVPSGKQESNRIKDNLLKFRLVEIKNNKETIVLDNKTYKDLTNKRIWVNTIDKNTTEEIKITYRLYMWISKSTLICSGDIQDNCDYYLNGTSPSWSDVFASINVDVTGDFNEKEISNSTEEACFTSGIVNTYKLNTNMTTDELNKCITYVGSWENYQEGETPGAFCGGTGTYDGNTFQEILDMTYSNFSVDDITYFETNNIISKSEVVAILDYDVSCGLDVIIPSTIQGYPVTIIGNEDTNVVKQLTNKRNNSKLDDLNNYNKNYKVDLMATRLFNGAFQEKNLTSVVIPDSVTIIDDSAFSINQLTSITIPGSVTTIGYGAFLDNQLTNIKLSNSLMFIGTYAFYDNQLTNVTIPDSVTAIGDTAFGNNQLINISIGSGIKYIGNAAFIKDDDSNPNLESIKINLTCSDIKNIPNSANNGTIYYPWLVYKSLYGGSSSLGTVPGVTMYGLNNEVCDSY